MAIIENIHTNMFDKFIKKDTNINLKIKKIKSPSLLKMKKMPEVLNDPESY